MGWGFFSNCMGSGQASFGLHAVAPTRDATIPT